VTAGTFHKSNILILRISKRLSRPQFSWLVPVVPVLLVTIQT
jgi:hypothetical protein